ncbi:glycosyltransferase family 4 protein [bacterium]|nr:glycosyltransferase family 4 protein [bacterium]
MKKLIFFTDLINTGGTEKSIVSLINEIRNQSQDFEIKVCSLSNVDNFKWFFETNKIQIDFLGVDTVKNRFSSIFKIIKYLRKENPDIIHLNLKYSIIFGGLASKFCKIKSVLTTIRMHELWKLETGFKFKVERLFVRFAYSKINKVICVAHSIKKFEEKIKVFNTKKLKVIHNGIDLSLYENLKPKTDLRKELGFDEKTKIILTVGRLDPMKGLQFLIEATPKILAKQPNTKVLIVGEGSYRNELENLIAKLKLEKDVFLVGLKTIEEVQNFYQNSDIFVFPTLSEGLSNVLLESMINGLPVVATEIGGNCEIIENEKSGILIEPENSEQIAEKVCEILANPEKAKFLSENAQKRVREEFSIQKTAKEYLKLYEQGLKNYSSMHK